MSGSNGAFAALKTMATSGRSVSRCATEKAVWLSVSSTGCRSAGRRDPSHAEVEAAVRSSPRQ